VGPAPLTSGVVEGIESVAEPGPEVGGAAAAVRPNGAGGESGNRPECEETLVTRTRAARYGGRCL
jgi:hypothetical protein